MNKQLQHIATALLLLVLLGAGKAWGQPYYACGTGNWSSNSIWFTDPSCSTPAPNPPEIWREVIINTGAIITDDVRTHNANKTINGKLIVPSTVDYRWVDVTIGDGGSIDVTGDLSLAKVTAGNDVSIKTTGSLTISGVSTFGTNSLLTIGNALTLTGNTTVDTYASWSVTNNFETVADASFASYGTYLVGGTLKTNGAATGFRSEQSSRFEVTGNLIHTSNFTTNGEVIIKGNYLPTGGSLTVESEGILVIKGYATANLDIHIDGQLLVSGDYTFTGGNIDINPTGAFVVGGDLTANSGITVDGYIAVYGDFKNPSQPTLNGTAEFVVVGTSNINNSGTPCSTCQNTIETDDPVWNIDEGWRSLYWEDFSVNTSSPHNWDDFSCWTLTSPATITSNQLTFTAPSRNSYTLWETCEIATGCYTTLTISANVTGTGKGNAVLQYSVYENGQWSEWAYNNQNAVPVHPTNDNMRLLESLSANRIKLRLIALDIMSGYTITLDNISISGTRGYGEAISTIALDPDFAELTVCEGETYTYKLTDEYYSYLWVANGGSIIGADNEQTVQVSWANGADRTLNITVQNACGLEENESFPISNTDGAFKTVLVAKEDLYCSTSNTGSITVKGFCGSGDANYTYAWSDGPTTATRTNLAAGTYTVVCTDNGAMPIEVSAPLVVTINAPTSITINTDLENSELKSCEEGCNGILVFEVSGPENHNLSVSLDSDDAALTVSNTVRLDFDCAQAATGYQYKIVIDRDRFPVDELLFPNFSDIRFFKNNAGEPGDQLYYWMDPLSANGSKITFYVRTDVSIGTNSIWMTYGNDSYPSYNSLAQVLDQGQMFIGVYGNASFTGAATSCNSSDPDPDYRNGESLCGTTLTKAAPTSIYLAGWYTIPNKDYFNIPQPLGSTSNVYFNGQLLTGSVNGSGNTEYKRHTITSYIGQTIYIEVWYSKPANVDVWFGGRFSSNSGNYSTGSDIAFDLSKGFSKKYLSPEPGQPRFVESYRYTGLCQGTYTLTVVDIDSHTNPALRCTATASETIALAVANHTWGTFPNDYSDLIGTPENVPGQTLYDESFTSITTNNNGWTTSGSWATNFADRNNDLQFKGNADVTITKYISTVGFSSIFVELEAYQSVGKSGAGWDATDYLELLYTVDGGVNWTRIVYDAEVWKGESDTDGDAIYFAYDGNEVPTAYINPAALSGANGQDDFGIRIRFKTDNIDELYYLKNLTITGTMANTISPATSGTPTVVKIADGTDAGITPTFVDQVTVGCSGGNRILRTWTATDDCGNSISQVQTISLAARLPEFTGTVFVPNTRYGFCHRTVTFTIPQGAGPASNPTCTPWTLGYTLDGGTTRIPISWSTDNNTGETFDLTFAIGSNNNFQWYLTDGINATAYYTAAPIAIDPIITATFDYSPSQDFCSGNSVTVTVTPSGGSGSFASYSFESTIPTTITGTDGSGATGVWTTNGFKNGDQVQVTITDTATPTGCSETIVDTGSSFTIHDEITTNPIQTAP